MFELFWEGHQYMKINEAANKAFTAGEKAERTWRHIYELERRMDRMALACQAMWELLREREGVTDKDIEQKMEEIDLRDGCRDGKMSRCVVKCPSCGRKSSSTRSSCLYCGSELEKSNTFE